LLLLLLLLLLVAAAAAAVVACCVLVIGVVEDPLLDAFVGADCAACHLRCHPGSCNICEPWVEIQR